MVIWRCLPCVLLFVALSEGVIFYPPFPPPGQYHQASPQQPVLTQHSALTQQSALPQAAASQPRLQQQSITLNQPNQLLALLQQLLLQSQFPQSSQPQNQFPQQQLIQPTPTPEPPEAGEAPVAPTSPPAGEAVIEAGTGAAFGLSLDAGPGPVIGGQTPRALPKPVIYNIPNNAPNNPLPIAQIRNRFYERLCYQGQSTLMPANIPSLNALFGSLPVVGDTMDPPSCSCIGYADCESMYHMIINQKTKDVCGTILTGFICCCEEPPLTIGRKRRRAKPGK